MRKETKTYIKIGFEEHQIKAAKQLATEEGCSVAEAIRKIYSGGLDNLDTSFLLKENVDTNLNNFRVELKDVKENIQTQANRNASLTIKALKDSAINKAILIEFIQYGSLTKDDIERIEKAATRELFQSLNGNKKSGSDS
ncbi:hypothetical protein [Poseidonibacter ostreae]|uniref:Uncharacterized protein n=1 Tax=Poseidonibacter ostreae TaxID=2654171 RepID=A0A6L4WTS7_9BACT|nr:hypothetical protein [Poseidonibacter ostreae]KAB7889550.1 hypothetical protein GBG19_05705 [Poseidonibacter ostreae]